MKTPIADFVPVRKDPVLRRSQSTSVPSDNLAVASGFQLNNPSSFELSSQALSDSVATPISKLVFRLIAILLTVTALAKLWMLLNDPFADVRVGLPKEILWLSVAFELWLAFENFRIRDRHVLSFINTIVFASFGIFAAIRWTLGYTSCGCSGSLELPPWFFLLIDFSIVGWFSWTSARRSRLVTGWNSIFRIWSGCSTESRGRIAGLFLFSGLLLVFQFPFAAPVRAMILGEPPIVAVVKIDGELIKGKKSSGKVLIKNRSLLPVKIIGISQSCRCFDIEKNPVSCTIHASASLLLPIVIQPKQVGPLHQRIILFLDHPKQFQVAIDVCGSINEE